MPTDTDTAPITTPANRLPENPIASDEYRCSITDPADGREFTPISRGEGKLCFYLPGVQDPTKLIFNCQMGEEITAQLNGQTYSDVVRFSLDATAIDHLTFTFQQADGTAETKRYDFLASSANILWLSVDDQRGSFGAVNADRAHETYCYGSLAYLAAEENADFTSAFSLKGRGNATWDDEKKGYALKLYQSDECTAPNKISISGMGSSNNWILVANHRDRTLIRNALAQTLAAKLGMENAVGYVFVDLYVDGEYLGLYNLMQKVESGKEQVDIKEAETDSLSGGYLLEFDNYSDTPQIKLKKSGMLVTVNSPDDLESYSAIEKRLNEAEVALRDPDGYNAATGLYWDDYIDKHSFAILWMVREYTMDNDATVNFRFYYDAEDGKFHGGPAWDFDNSMARNNGIFAQPEQPLIETGHRNKDCWLRKLLAFDEFRQEIGGLYRLHRPLFDNDSDQSIYAMAYRLQEDLSYSIGLNFTVWERQLSNPSWNTPDEPTYEGHFGILTDFLRRRNGFWATYVPELVG